MTATYSSKAVFLLSVIISATIAFTTPGQQWTLRRTLKVYSESATSATTQPSYKVPPYRRLSAADWAVQTRTIQSRYKSLDDWMDVTGDVVARLYTLAVAAVTVAAAIGSAILAGNTMLPDGMRYVCTTIMAFAPFVAVAWVGRMASTDASSATTTTAGATPQPLQSLWQSRTRRLQHEAGHFLIGYLLGVTVTGYSVKEASAVEVLTTRGDTWPLAVTTVGGVAAELLAFGTATGGVSDWAILQDLWKDDEDDETLDDRSRFLVAYALTLLRQHVQDLDRLADAMDAGASVKECRHVLEESAGGTSSSLTPEQEAVRREKLRGRLSWSDRFLDNEKNMFVTIGDSNTGKSPTGIIPAVTDDDPFYFALAASLGFFLWASAGGLTL